jgi:HK97 family phage major capsid protein
MILNEVLQKRGEVIAQMRTLTEKVAKENREMTSEENSQYDAMNVEITRLGKDKERLEALTALESDNARQTTPSLRPGVDSKATDKRSTKEYEQAFFASLRSRNPYEFSAVLDSQSGSGGTLVPTVLEDQIVKKLLNFAPLRSICQVRQAATNAIIPVQATLPTATWVAEDGAYSESDPTFAPVDLYAYKLTSLAKVSEELLYDAVTDLNAELSDSFANAIAHGEEQAFVVGTGSGQPKGITLDAPLGITASGAAISTLTSDNIIDTFHGLKKQYRPGASWLLNDQVVAAIRKMKNTVNYIWQPGLVAGNPDMLMGAPVYVSDYMPAPAASAVIGVFGNFHYYRIQDRVGIAIQRLNELYSGNGQVGFRLYKRLDGKCVLTEAFTSLVLAAS